MSKILIVDDEPKFSEVLKDRLESQNYEVSVANDGNEGIMKAKEDQPDLIFLTAAISEEEAKTLQEISIEDKRFKTASKTSDMKELIGKIESVLSSKEEES